MLKLSRRAPPIFHKGGFLKGLSHSGGLVRRVVKTFSLLRRVVSEGTLNT